MSERSVILRFKAAKEYESSWSLVSKVETILKKKKLKVKTLKPLPYKSCQKKSVEFRVPDTTEEYVCKHVEGEKTYFYYYFYYMANDQNLPLENIQKKLGNEALIALDNQPFMTTRTTATATATTTITTTNNYNNNNNNKEIREESKLIEDLKKQYQEELENKYEVLRKRCSEELEGERVENQKAVKKLILEHDKEMFILQKQNELLLENAKLQVERLGGDKSVISWDNFRLSEDEMALKFNPCKHRISKADYKQMLKTNNNLVHCVICRGSLRGREVEDFHWKEDWPLTYFSEALSQHEIIRANAEPICTLQQMKKQGKLREVKKLELLAVPKAAINPEFIIPRIIYNESEMLTTEQKIKLENEMPQFLVDPAGKLTMDSTLLNRILELSSCKSFFQQRESLVSGAHIWRQTKYPGSKYFTMPMPRQSTNEMLRYLYALNDPELNQDILAIIRNSL